MALTDISLQYVPLRGLVEPLLLMLINSGRPFEYSTITYEEISALREQGKLNPEDGYPFGLFPILTAKYHGESFVLSECLAIGALLEEEFGGGILQCLRERKAKKGALIKAKEKMLTTAAATHRFNIFYITEPGWITVEKLEGYKQEFVLTNLRRLEYQLNTKDFDHFFSVSSEMTGRQDEPLSVAEAYIAYALDLMILFWPTVFPNSIPSASLALGSALEPNADHANFMRRIESHSIDEVGKDTEFPLCAKLHWNVYHGRSRIREWWVTGEREGYKRDLSICKGEEGSWEYIVTHLKALKEQGGAAVKET
ncbi:hypothetical protein BT69DRAFT_1324566 [Atractiella rhizophila]|nr:hypothetical protein BT69DRAFT_1324566 [Atractiella rhizophila]